MKIVLAREYYGILRDVRGETYLLTRENTRRTD